MMRKIDDAVRRAREAEAALQSEDSGESEALTLRCLKMEGDITLLQDQLADQGYEPIYTLVLTAGTDCRY